MRRPPNILLCLIDDLGWRDLGCYGSTFYETPNLDNLASQGARFTDAYASSPLCMPSRASVMSGQYPARCGMTGLPAHGNGPAWGRLRGIVPANHLPKGTVTLADALREGGYKAWHVGKWHCGDEEHSPERHGFDVNIGGGTAGRPKDGYFSPWNLPALANAPEGTDLTDHLTDRAISLINGAGANPWFLNLWHYAVHDPIEAKAEDVEYFRRKACDSGLDKIDPFVAGEMHPDGMKKHIRLRRRVIQSDPVYAAMIYNLDRNVSRLWQAIEKADLAEDTILVFTSDNGGLHCHGGEPPTANVPLAEGKGWAQDGGVREPFFVVAPGRVAPGRTENTAISLCDLYPSFLDAAGLPSRPMQHIDGLSFWPLVTGTGSYQREALFFHHPHYSPQGDTPHGAIRMGNWKLIEHYEDGRVELYNLHDDIGESRDMALAAPERRDELFARLSAWRKEVGAIVPAANERWPEASRVRS